MDPKDLENKPKEKSFLLSKKKYGYGKWFLAFVLLDTIFNTYTQEIKPHSLSAPMSFFVAVVEIILNAGAVYFLTLWIIDLIRRRGKIERLENKRVRLIVNIIFAILFLMIITSIAMLVFKPFSSSVPDEDVQPLKTEKSVETSEISGNLYRNTKYHFRIKFPDGWEIKVGDGPNIVQKAVQGNSTISIGIKEIPAEYGDESATIKDILSLVEFRDGILEGVQEKFPDAKLLDYGETKLDNETTYYIKHSAPYSALDINIEGINIQYQLLRKNILYFITAGTLSNEFGAKEPELKKSIATFVIEDY
ncbi:MAG: hypothetical protein AAB415_02920 [Patescibacteria group bacterium]